jgi:hypothetical protein
MTLQRAALWAAAFAVLGAAVLLGSRDVFWSGDFYDESWQSYQALQRGDLSLAWDLTPAYTSFAVLFGFPAALLAGTFGGLETAVIRLAAVPGLLATCWLLVHLTVKHMGTAPVRFTARLQLLALLLVAAAPMIFVTIRDGHPEDVLAAATCVGAVLAARSGRPVAAALLVVLAAASKQWGILALGPALVAAPHGHRRLAAIALIGAGAVVGAETLFHPLARTGAVVPVAADFFHPQQVWWPLGIDAPAAWTAAGHGELTSPVWLRPFPKPLIVLLSFVVPAVWWLRCRATGRRLEPTDALLVLALVFLLRCVLDPWNLVYYHLPLVLALGAWEVARGQRRPVLAIGVSAAAWLTFVTVDMRTGMAPFLLYMVWALPLLGAMVTRLWTGRFLDLRLTWRFDSQRPGSPTAPA